MTIVYQGRFHDWFPTKRMAEDSHAPFIKLDVPTDRAGLCDFLTAYAREVVNDTGVADAIGSPDEVTETVTPSLPHDSTIVELPAGPDEVMEWVLNRATNAQVEQLFAALGARFHEANDRTHAVHR